MNRQISELERSQNRTDLGAEHLYEQITSDRTETPPEPAENGDKLHHRETKMSQDIGTTILLPHHK